MNRGRVAVVITGLVIGVACSNLGDSGDSDPAGGKGDDPSADAGQVDAGAPDAAPPDAAPPTAFRIAELKLADPGVFAFGLNVTNTVNTSVRDSMTMDKDPIDGKLDWATLLVFRPLDLTAGASPALDVVLAADCTAPVETTSCAPSATGVVVSAAAVNATMPGACLAPLPGTATGAVLTPMAPCFATDARPLQITLGGFTIALEAVRVGATYAGDGTLANGLLVGFLTETAAMNTPLPASLPLVGGRPLSTVLRPADKDTGPAGASGWWFHLNFTAVRTTFAE
jgi:hypothetical protein